MDRIRKTTAIIKTLNDYNDNIIEIDKLIYEVCNYFDYIKNYELSQHDKTFLFNLAVQIGIPQYYDILKSFKDNDELQLTQLNLKTFSSFLYESSLFSDEEIKLHKYQKEILKKFYLNKENRYFLSASTSFGKTFLVYEIIKKMKYKNIILIFPTIALLSENLEKIKDDIKYIYFQDNFAIHTLSKIDEDDFGINNIFLFTPERFLSFLDQNGFDIDLDFIFVDEVYKIDNDYVIDEDTKENERDLAYRMAVHYAFEKYTKIDCLLVGPYINFYNKNEKNYNPSFDNFLKHRRIQLINRNSIEIVNKKIHSIKSAQKFEENTLGEILFIDEKGNKLTQKAARLNIILNHLYSFNSILEKTIIYCSTKNYVEKYAKEILKAKIFNNYDYTSYNVLLKHISSKFHKDWVVLNALKSGIGIHHGSIPKYIQKDIINLFNQKDGGIFTLISTTTITEGVNTSAKNLIVLNSKKGTKPLKKFDAKNIIGRAGRFHQHYTGRVLILQSKEFEEILNSDDEFIKHKNYDTIKKDDLDIEITEDEYLSEAEIKRREEIFEKQRIRDIPDEIIKQFKVVSREDKIKIYDSIKNLTTIEKNKIKQLIIKVNYLNPQIDYDGFEVFIKVIKPIIPKNNKNMLFLFEKSTYNKTEPSKYSRITYKLHYYLKDGFKGLFDFNKDKLNMSVDESMRKSSEFIFNTLKYQLVKYLGVFNLMYKVERSHFLQCTCEDIDGIDRLLIKLEYNAFSKEARIANDYGVPNNIIRYFDLDENNRKKIKLDDYEKIILEKIQKIINDKIK